MSRQSVLWVLAGLAGITLAAGITWATSQLTSQHIGLSSEPVSAARGLAPHVTETAPRPRTPASTTRKRPTLSTHARTTVQPAVGAPAATSTTSPAPAEAPAPAEPAAPATTTGTPTFHREGGRGDDGAVRREGRAGRERDD